jgi:hypothetical protein
VWFFAYVAFEMMLILVYFLFFIDII